MEDGITVVTFVIAGKTVEEEDEEEGFETDGTSEDIDFIIIN